MLNQSKRITGGNLEQIREDLPMTMSQLSERFLSADALSSLFPPSRESDVEIRNLLTEYDEDDLSDVPEEGEDEEPDEVEVGAGRV
jgi:RNA recognition motif-containing protein